MNKQQIYAKAGWLDSACHLFQCTQLFCDLAVHNSSLLISSILLCRGGGGGRGRRDTYLLPLNMRTHTHTHLYLPSHLDVSPVGHEGCSFAPCTRSYSTCPSNPMKVVSNSVREVEHNHMCNLCAGTTCWR